MASPQMSPGHEQRICAVRLPGASRARFADAGDVELELGDWVAVRTLAGEEAGRVVVAPDQWLSPVERDDAVPVLRRLSEPEIERLAGHIERARERIDLAAGILRQHAPDTFLSGLRYTLDGGIVVASLTGPVPMDTERLTTALASRLGADVTLEQEHGGHAERSLLGGGPGRAAVQRPETFRELLERRFDVLRQPETFAPQGLPRLGTMVETGQGTGQLIAVDIRHWRATVALRDDEEVIVSVDDLREPGSTR